MFCVALGYLCLLLFICFCCWWLCHSGCTLGVLCAVALDFVTRGVCLMLGLLCAVILGIVRLRFVFAWLFGFICYLC